MKLWVLYEQMHKVTLVRQLTLGCLSLKTFFSLHFVAVMIPTLILTLNMILLAMGDSGGFGNFPYVLTPIQPPTPGTGTVPGYRQCGGNGKILDWRNPGCSGYTLPEQGATTTLCTLRTGIPLQSEIDFRVGRTTPQLKIKYFFFEHGNFTQVLDEAIDNSAVIAGHGYTLHHLWKIPAAFSGETITFKGVLYRGNDNGIEFCGLVHYHVQ